MTNYINPTPPQLPEEPKRRHEHKPPNPIHWPNLPYLLLDTESGTKKGEKRTAVSPPKRSAPQASSDNVPYQPLHPSSILLFLHLRPP